MTPDQHRPPPRRWEVKRGETMVFFDGLVLQRGQVRGMLDLSVCLGESSANLQLLAPVVAAACSEGIRKDTGIISWVHWPNLVAVDERAVGKTSAFRSPDLKTTVAGARVNCFASPSQANFSSAVPSTSILDALGVEIDIDLLRDRILEAVDWYTAEWERGVYGKLVARIQPSVPWMGERVEAKTARAGLLVGKALALDEEGSLLLERRRGTPPRALRPGDVEHVLPVRRPTHPRSEKNTLL